jgi:mannose/cellobiose epimerase-like protein (N-acyl-D-glucosamine 2-epimerase family)
MRNIALIIGLVLYTGIARADYTVKSEYLKNPEKNIDLVIQTAEFWKNARDDVNGGFYIYVDEVGNPTYPDESWWFTEECDLMFDYHLKSVFGQSRLAYAFSKAFMLTGNLEYLEHAQHALDFMYEYGWDDENDGWFFTFDEEGTIAPWMPCDWWDPNDWKWSFNQLYALLGIAAISEATMDASQGPRFWWEEGSDNWDWLMYGVDMLEEKMWDSREAYLGYYENADLDWSNPQGKSFTGAADSITTHAMTLYLQTERPRFKKRLLDLADNIVDHLVPTIALSETLFGFVEYFDNEWGIDDSRQDGFVGHLMKAAWCLARAYLVMPRPEYREAAMAIIHEVWENGGYDHTYGGIYQDLDWGTGEIHDGKNFWNVEQGFTGGISNYHIAVNPADRDLNLQMADESIDFYMNHFRDLENGGTYTDTLDDGTPANTTKGHIWKAGYHASEFGYLGYLYGSLYYKKSDATLYYYFAPKPHAHRIKLTPLSIENRAIVISDVELNGFKFRHYNRNRRTLRIPPGMGGVFKVTFSPRRPNRCPRHRRFGMPRGC